LIIDGIATFTTVASRMIMATPRDKKARAIQRLLPVRTFCSESAGAFMFSLSWLGGPPVDQVDAMEARATMSTRCPNADVTMLAVNGRIKA
jgi:hypothetical protein